VKSVGLLLAFVIGALAAFLFASDAPRATVDADFNSARFQDRVTLPLDGEARPHGVAPRSSARPPSAPSPTFGEEESAAAPPDSSAPPAPFRPSPSFEGSIQAEPPAFGGAETTMLPTTGRVGLVPEELIARRLTLPVVGIKPEELRPHFYDARGARGHEAIDIMAPRGRPVVAVEDGVISKLFTSAAGGLTIYQFDPAERYTYYYAHLDAYAPGLKEGDRVSRGQIIGTVGSTGNAGAAGPHLHFAVFALGPEKKWWQGTALDPYPLLARKEVSSD
jgi:murein DD-endopeptidase MepM/ murein hydrolase activator NlpD